MGQFSAGSFNKTVPSFTSTLTKVCEWRQKTAEYLSLLKKMFALMVFALS